MKRELDQDGLEAAARALHELTDRQYKDVETFDAFVAEWIEDAIHVVRAYLDVADDD